MWVWIQSFGYQSFELENEVTHLGFPDEHMNQMFSTLLLDCLIQSHYLHVLPVKVNDWAEHLGTVQKGSVQMCYASE